MVGFNIYRAESSSGTRTQLNTALIPVLHGGALQGDSYQFADNTAVAGVKYYYWVEMVGIGDNQTFGPAEGVWFSNFVYLPGVLR